IFFNIHNSHRIHNGANNVTKLNIMQYLFAYLALICAYPYSPCIKNNHKRLNQGGIVEEDKLGTMKNEIRPYS
ncbi:TPA: hypothetical protein ACF2QT_002122, partial [Legionella pneumophila]